VETWWRHNSKPDRSSSFSCFDFAFIPCTKLDLETGRHNSKPDRSSSFSCFDFAFIPCTKLDLETWCGDVVGGIILNPIGQVAFLVLTLHSFRALSH